MKTMLRSAIAGAVLITLSAAAPIPALAVQDKERCYEAVGARNDLDIREFCPRSEWPETYSAGDARKVVMAPIRAFLSAFGLR